MDVRRTIKSLRAKELVLEKTLESPLDRKKIKPVNPKRNQPWILIGRTDAEAEAPTLWPTNSKNQLIGKGPDARKNQGQEEKGMTEGEMVGWHHQLNGHTFEGTLGDSEGQRSLSPCSSQGFKELTLIQWLKNNLWLTRCLRRSLQIQGTKLAIDFFFEWSEDTKAEETSVSSPSWTAATFCQVCPQRLMFLSLWPSFKQMIHKFWMIEVRHYFKELCFGCVSRIQGVTFC